MADADRQSLRLTWNFRIKSSDEVAVTGLNYSSAPGWTGSAAALAEIEAGVGWGTGLLNLMDDFLHASPMYWADYSELRSIRIAAVGADGIEIGDALEYETEIALEGNITNTLPQSTLCLSLRSGMTTGAANYGRMFLPHTRIPLVALTARASPSITSQIANTAKTFINGVTALVDALVTATVFPVIITHKTGAASKIVASLAVGDITDTQQRRRNRLPEQYSFIAL